MTAKGKPAANELFKGRSRALAALGYSKDKRGRVRKNGRPVRTQEVVQAAAKIDAQKKRSLSRTKLLTGLKKTTGKKELEEFTIKDAAEWTGRSPRTIQKWIREGGTPPEALDCIRAKLSNEECYSSKWKHGKKRKPSNDDEKKLRRALAMFVQGKRRRAKDIKKRYEDWYKTKKQIRDKLTKKAWKDLMKKIGRREGLSDEGPFSVMRLTLS